MLTSSYEEEMKVKGYLPILLGYLPEEVMERARTELNETDEIRGPAIMELRRLVLAEKNLKCLTDDAYLIQFLRARKFDVKKAMNHLQTFYHVKKDYPECYTEFGNDALRICARSGVAYLLPYRTTDGCVVLVIDIAKWNCVESDIIVGMKLLTLLLLYAVEDPATQVCGIRFLVNVRGTTLRQIRSIGPRYIHLFSKALRNTLPCRFKGIHILNESTIFHYIWSILKLFLTEKIKKRVCFHGDNLKQLQKYIPKEILSPEYGGLNTMFNAGESCLKAVENFKEKAEIILSCGYSD